MNEIWNRRCGLTFFAISIATFGLIALIVHTSTRYDSANYSRLKTYNASKPVAIEGPVMRASFDYPRASVGMRHDGEDWTVMLAAPSRMTSRGATVDKIQVGRVLTAFGYASSGGDPQMRAERIVIEGHQIPMR